MWNPKFSSKLLPVCAGAAALVFAAATVPAADAAAVKMATYTGTLDDGFDLTGIFGAPGGDLTGLTYVTTYTYALGVGGHQGSVPGVFEGEYGGGFDGSANPMLRATVTINGVTVAIAPDWYGEVQTASLPYVHDTGETFSDNGIDLNDVTISNSHHALGAPWSLSTNVSTTTVLDPRYAGLSYFQIVDYKYAIGDYTVLTYGDFGAVGTYSVSDVPEPVTWSIMLTGFFGAGLALRRSRKAMPA